MKTTVTLTRDEIVALLSILDLCADIVDEHFNLVETSATESGIVNKLLIARNRIDAREYTK